MSQEIFQYSWMLFATVFFFMGLISMLQSKTLLLVFKALNTFNSKYTVQYSLTAVCHFSFDSPLTQTNLNAKTLLDVQELLYNQWTGIFIFTSFSFQIQQTDCWRDVKEYKMFLC